MYMYTLFGSGLPRRLNDKMHIVVGAQKTRCGALRRLSPMGDQFASLVNQIQALGDRELVSLLAIVATAVSDRLIATEEVAAEEGESEQEEVEPEEEINEDLERAPWRRGKGKAKGAGKGKGNAKGRNHRGKGGPYGK